MISLHPPSDNRSQPELDGSYEVVVVGGGPAGATVGALTAEQGHRVLILERSSVPRFHLGESLIPETYWTLKRLGLIEQLQQSAFPKKFSVQFVSEDGEESAPFYFDEYKSHESSQTWQVERSEFDRMLLERAEQLGAVVRTDAQVLTVMFDGDRATGVRVKLTGQGGSENLEIPAKIVVDATGQSTFLANRLGLKRPDDRLKKGSVWSYFRGALRDTGRDEGATIILQSAGKMSWFWYIPLPDDIVSVGCTGNLSEMFAGDRGGPEQIFHQELARCPGMQHRLKNAVPVTEYLTTRDFSYSAAQAAGPGWILVGDALGFIDPVYSSGVFLALKSGEFAADALHEALVDDDASAQRLGCWYPKYSAGVDLFRKLVYAFYTPGFSFGKFLRKYPQFHGNLVDILIGDVFKPGVGKMFDAMGEVVPPTSNPHFSTDNEPQKHGDTEK
jgi:flavin-dependent dehydrogenase